MAVSKAQERSTRKSIPQIPFFGEGNPLEWFFGSGVPAEEMSKLRRVSVSVKEEREYGERVLDAMRQNWKQRGIDVISRGGDAEYVQQLIDGLKPSMKNHERYPALRVLIAQTDETDAYSIPGGTIIVFRGMLNFAGSEAALVGVLGHELSHLDRQHQLLPLQRSKMMQSSFRVTQGMSFDQMMRQASMVMSAFMRPFHPEDETEADRDGATWAYRANYDPREMARMFARMRDRDEVGKFVPSFLRTHPYHDDRRDAIEKLYDELQRAEPRKDLHLGRENLRRRIPMAVRKLGE